MKNMITKNGKAVVLTVIISLFCLPGWSSAGLTDNSSKRIQNEIQVQAGDESPCYNLSEFLKKEFQSVTKPRHEKPKKRLYGIQKKDAMTKALQICAKLKATPEDTDDEDMIYRLPDGLGNIILRESSKEHVFLYLIFDTECDLPYTEIKFVSIEYYNEYDSE